MANLITIEVQAWIMDMYPKPDQSNGSGNGLKSLANGLALPSFWNSDEITQAFKVANRIWKQADIEFTPISVAERSDSVPADEKEMFYYFVNNLSPKKGFGVGFVYDLPEEEGGWGAGRMAVIAGVKMWGASTDFQGSILAHELGHCLLGHTHTDNDSTN